MSFVENLTQKIESIRSNLQQVVESVRPGILSGQANIQAPRLKIIETLREQGYKPGLVIESAMNRIKEIRERIKIFPGREAGSPPAPRPAPKASSEAEVYGQLGTVHIVGEEKPTVIYSQADEMPVEEVTAEETVTETTETKPKRSFFY